MEERVTLEDRTMINGIKLKWNSFWPSVTLNFVSFFQQVKVILYGSEFSAQILA